MAIVEAGAALAAQDVLRDRILEERIAFVEKHRKRLVRDAERETERAKERYLGLVGGVEQLREELVGLRQTAVWAAVYQTLSNQGKGRRADERVSRTHTPSSPKTPRCGRRRLELTHGAPFRIPRCQYQ